VRRLAVIALVLAALPAAAANSAGDPTRPPTLTLSAPGATTYGHQVDFAGRLSPGAAGVRVQLLRGSTFVTAGATDGSGSFRLKVAVARPGPFHAEAAGIASAPVTIRIVPFLDTSLVGARVAGSPLALNAKLRPSYAGRLRVRVERTGGQTFSRLFGPAADVRLGTRSTESFRVVVDGIPAPGFKPVSRTLPVSLHPPTLSVGTSSPQVAELLRRLGSLGYAVPSTTQTVFDDNVLESVYAFEKVENLARTGVVDAAFWARLEHPRIPQARYQFPAAHIEVDKGHQVLYIVRDGKVALISPVSTAGIPGYFTPLGRFAIYRKVPGYDNGPLGVLYKPMYFTGGYAIHGNPSVPPYPASHGCVRVPNFVIERLYGSEPYGETVYVY
jgi:N-acetylmuramoyl-L-alanine amidase